MLYIVATPIGNLTEITYRAVQALKQVDYILCEDTRTSSVLLKEYDIKKPLMSYHKFNEREQLNKIITDLKNGSDIALISDAGMPCVSDPGNILVNECIAQNLDYTVLSGASAFVNAFVLSGFETPFTFVGFLPQKNTDKKELLKQLKNNKTTLIFYSSPYDLQKDLDSLYQILGERKVCIARELTKKFEEVVFIDLSQGYNGVLKGEFVVVVQKGGDEDSPLNQLSIEEHLDFYLNLGYSKSDSIEMVAKERNMKKNEVYKIAHTTVLEDTK